MNESTLLIETSNENQTLVAVVQQDSRAAYFYIYPTEEYSERFQVRACWLRNLGSAPLQEDRAAMEAGQPPMLAAEYCRNLAGEAPLNPEGLAVIWAESDDGAALWYDGQLLAVIPGWSLYIEHSVCYSASCIKESSLVWPLGSASTNSQYALAEHTRQFWRSWQREEGNPWPKMRSDYQACYEQHFGPMVKYYAIDQGKWPPMAITQHQSDGVYYFLTIGASIRPMPWVEILFNDDAAQYRRMEMGIAIDGQYMSEESAIQMASALAGFVHVPWARITWFGEGHSLESEAVPQGYAGYVLSSSFYPEQGRLNLPQQYGDPVNLFWASPVFGAERERAQAAPHGGHDLVNKLREQGVDHVFRPRQPLA
ncbi:Suppressor of fused protein (SUFU) [Chania multitudinisentens RB-25]|uniref:Suppressor of fused protein (SUFU) n=1 Tax=Chania multitudinisentens RB-25 TaxID=1441930 RepID=W0LCZ8_9GAMM|nr:suppressor of fused domain protein [Chania multitudinisentens]AHG21718.1 Suppressor of fused protein (SUFU) [Chania multitudinisentens RB-25]